MTEPGAVYDRIGSQYDEYARTATLKAAERYTLFRMVGPVEGQRVMDLACGSGFYTRLLKQRGAAQVVGVDISPEMIRLASQREQVEPLGITYQVGDAVSLPLLGPHAYPVPAPSPARPPAASPAPVIGRPLRLN